MEATRKLQRQLEERDVAFHCLVFLRNDIHDLLVADTPDRGKDTAISLDWDDEEVFKELVRQRVRVSSGIDGSFDEVWETICDRFVGTQDSFRFMVVRTLMRPRDLLNFMHSAIGVAINRGHERVLAGDIEKAEESYSEDMLLSTAFELRDIHPQMLNTLYTFHRSPDRMTKSTVTELLSSEGSTSPDEVMKLLVWVGFLGVQETGQEEAVYSYEVRYNVEKLLSLVERGRAAFVIHPSFRKALEIS